jgi:purine-binding chemotaxis protein CheW
VKAAQRSATPHGGGASLAGRYLTLLLGSQSCAIPIQKVREIISFPGFPGVPPAIGGTEGLIHLRGQAIPIMDLRSAFGIPPSPPTSRTCVVVTQVAAPTGETRLVGLLVDGVDEVIHVKDEHVGAPVDSAGNADPRILLGMAQVEGAVRNLLDVDRAAARAIFGPVAQRRRNPRSRR